LGLLIYIDVTWQINSENVSTFRMAVPSLLNNTIKIAITPTLPVNHKSKVKGWSVAGGGASPDDELITGCESLAVDLQYKNAHFIRFIQF
jgi:hypothetical protein